MFVVWINIERNSVQMVRKMPSYNASVLDFTCKTAVMRKQNVVIAVNWACWQGRAWGTAMPSQKHCLNVAPPIGNAVSKSGRKQARTVKK
jgi:hypothetical protein